MVLYNEYNRYQELKHQLTPLYNEQEQLDSLLMDARKKFPIGAKVKILHTGYTGEVVSYNNRLGGFYPGVRYPVCVRITYSEKVEFRERAVGSIFEYGMEQLKA